MRGKTIVLIITVLFGRGSGLNSRIRNVTQLFKERYNPNVYENRMIRGEPVVRDVSYLPEEDYAEELEARQEALQHYERDNRNLMPEYRNLCETVTRKIQMSDSDYEYLPPHYHEIYCKSYSLIDQAQRVQTMKTSEQKCVQPGFHCVQRSRTLFMVRRLWDSDCWEPFTKVVASGCDCMWPVSLLGDISIHY